LRADGKFHDIRSSESESVSLAESTGYTEIAMAANQTPTPEETLETLPAEPAAGTLEEMPVLTVRDTVIFPGAMLPITVGRPSSVALVNSLGENRLLAVVSQLDPRVDTPRAGGSLPGGHGVRDAQGHPRAQGQPAALLRRPERLRTSEFTATEPFLKARVERIPDIEPEITPEVVALRQNVVSLFQQIVTASPNLSDDLSSTAEGITAPGALADFVGRQSALAERRRAAEAAGTAGRARAPQRNQSPAHARVGTGGIARPDSIDRCRDSSRKTSASSICASS
jgi:hypothetical protein